MQVKKESKPEFLIEAKHTTHTGGKGEHLHDWYSYLEGFSSSFVKGILEAYSPNAKIVLEPFAGVGTTPLNCSFLGITSYYCEVNPVLRKVINTKEKISKLNGKKKEIFISKLLYLSDNISFEVEKCASSVELKERYFSCFGKSIFFSEEAFEKVLKFRSYIDKIDNDLVASSLEVALMSCIVTCSLLKRSGDVRFKTIKELDKGIPDFYDTVSQQLKRMALDCKVCPESKNEIIFLTSNAKDLVKHASINADIVITSPPYLNGTNYFRNTKLELWFIGELINDKSLRLFRDQVVTSGINDVTRSKGNEILPQLSYLYNELLEKSYDKRIAKMMAAYFLEMKLVIEGLKSHVVEDGLICIDIGDSIYSKIYIPTHKILIEIAKNIGLSLYDEVLLRKRTSKDGSPLGQFLLVFKRDRSNESKNER